LRAVALGGGDLGGGAGRVATRTRLVDSCMHMGDVTLGRSARTHSLHLQPQRRALCPARSSHACGAYLCVPSLCHLTQLLYITPAGEAFAAARVSLCLAGGARCGGGVTFLRVERTALDCALSVTEFCLSWPSPAPWASMVHTCRPTHNCVISALLLRHTAPDPRLHATRLGAAPQQARDGGGSSSSGRSSSRPAVQHVRPAAPAAAHVSRPLPAAAGD
jgi:hypothetical protein